VASSKIVFLGKRPKGNKRRRRKKRKRRKKDKLDNTKK
jgi:hypothetical protein